MKLMYKLPSALFFSCQFSQYNNAESEKQGIENQFPQLQKFTKQTRSLRSHRNKRTHVLSIRSIIVTLFPPIRYLQ